MSVDSPKYLFCIHYTIGMLFNSLHFVFFFLLVVPVYFVLPQKYRNLFLLVASCYFYMALIPVYILILAATIIIDYFAGLLIERHSGIRKKVLLLISLIANVGILATFKYLNFFLQQLGWAAGILDLEWETPVWNIVLPVGLSFHTFQAMSYTLEVFKGKQIAERNFINYALYVMFFPQLVAGPIERPQNLLHQFYQNHRPDALRIGEGLKKMLWGFFKKVVVADTFAQLADQVFDSSAEYVGLALLLGIIAFTIQIYCDFSGYSDIAIGAAQVLGFKLMINFRTPYLANSLSDFWRRWHISLSGWFRDYVYLPLGGSKQGPTKTYLAILIVFLLSGFWHGANFTFIIWGLLHGIGVLIEKAFNLDKSKNVSGFRNLLVLVFVGFSWIFFRSATLSEALTIIEKIPVNLLQSTGEFIQSIFVLGPKDSFSEMGLSINNQQLLAITIGILILAFVERIENKDGIWEYFNKKPIAIRWGFYFLLLGMIFLFGVYENRQFIYFQF